VSARRNSYFEFGGLHTAYRLGFAAIQNSADGFSHFEIIEWLCYVFHNACFAHLIINAFIRETGTE
jgi:hypothetical protein